MDLRPKLQYFRGIDPYYKQVLPTTTGGSITWISNFNPTSTSRPPGIPGSATPTATQAATEPNKGLSTGAKAGIAVGISVAGLIILGLFLWCCLTRRRRPRTQPHVPQQAHVAAQVTYPPTYHTRSISTAHSPMTATVAASPTGYDQQWHHSPVAKPYWAAGPGNDAFTGFKNELPADEIRPTEVASPSLGEVTPSLSARHDIVRAHSDASEVLPHDQRQDVAGGYYLSPQSTGSESIQLEDGTEHGHRETPSEMQG